MAWRFKTDSIGNRPEYKLSGTPLVVGGRVYTISDVDSGAATGIAITATNDGNGHWQYSTDGGTTWTNADAGGAVSATHALLLRDTDHIRFVPNGENATTASFDAQRQDFVDLRTRMEEGFARVDDGFVEIRGRLDGTAAGLQQIVDLLQAMAGSRGTNEPALVTNRST